VVRGIDIREYGAIFCGGFVGAIARVCLVQGFTRGDATWPWPTFIANLTGAFLLGYFSTRLQERLPVSTYRRPLLGTGFCGALTTFSTLQLELVTMVASHHFGLLLGYLVATLAAGFLAVWFATSLVRRTRVAV
jgi:fluoride exporter